MKRTEHDVIALHPNQTEVQVELETINEAIDAALWLSASPHEWEWSESQQIAMAKYVLWAHQRISAIDQCVNGVLERTWDDDFVVAEKT